MHYTENWNSYKITPIIRSAWFTLSTRNFYVRLTFFMFTLSLFVLLMHFHTRSHRHKKEDPKYIFHLNTSFRPQGICVSMKEKSKKSHVRSWLFITFDIYTTIEFHLMQFMYRKLSSGIQFYVFMGWYFNYRHRSIEISHCLAMSRNFIIELRFFVEVFIEQNKNKYANKAPIFFCKQTEVWLREDKR